MPHDGTGKTSEHVVDFNAARAQRMDEKRRNAERIFFNNLLSVYCVTGGDKLRPVEIIEVSEDGCSFRVPFDAANPWPSDAENIPLRLYFSQDTYLQVHVNIANSRPSIESGKRFVRYGCEIDKGVTSYPAYQQFVKFLKLYSEHAHKDMGDLTVFYI
ncbi:MAG: hypothetical protein A2583_13945 [Bdellovibrionales bacterium RIFOXYD1_FULL_53_11]|nr:MAG: hypothetical protein A2583_13945 [Bdellovibrionales bacterium RIFOXYD1_FULL_53_11]